MSSRLLLIAGLVASAGCMRKPPPPQMPPPPVVTVTSPVTFPVQQYYDYNGTLDALETTQIVARVKGVLMQVHFKEGDEVKKGDLLYTIDPREFEATVTRAQADIDKAVADAANANAQIALARTELVRLRSAAGPAIAQTEVDKAEATLQAAQAQLKVAQASEAFGKSTLRTANLQLGYTKVLAPIDGRISRTLITPGNLVGQSETTLLTTIVRVDELYVNFDAPERDLVEYLKSRAGETSLPSNDGVVQVGLATEKGYPHEGRIDFRETRVDAATGTVRIRGRLLNPKVGAGGVRLLYPGFYTRVRVPVGDPRPLPVIPEDAIMTGQEGKYIYVLNAENMVAKRTVSVVATPVHKAAAPAPGQPAPWSLAARVPPKGMEGKPPPPSVRPVTSVVAIEDGLAVGERIVVDGLVKIRPGAPVTPDDWDFKGPPPPTRKSEVGMPK